MAKKLPIKNNFVKARLTNQSLQMMVSGGSISGTIWRSHEIVAYSGLVLKRPVLDLGCGDGRFTHLLFANPLDIGLDLSGNAIGEARKKNWHKKYIIAPADKTKLPGASVNSVFSNSVFEHVTKLENVIKEVHRILKPGGEFVFTVHSLESKEFVIPKILRTIALKTLADIYEKFFIRMLKLHTLWTKKQWRERLKKNGFRVLEIRGTISAKSAFFYEILMPITLLQNRIPQLKSSFLTPLILKLTRLDLYSTGEKNYLIKAVKPVK